MATANEVFQDALIAHAIDVERFGAGLVRRMLRILDDSTDVAAKQLAGDLAALGPNPFSSKAKIRRLNKILARLSETRGAAYAEMHAALRAELRALAPFEAAWTVTSFEDAVGLVEARLDMPASQVLRSLPTTRAMEGLFLKEWSSKLRRDDAALLLRLVRGGVQQGQNLDQIIESFRATTPISRRHAAAMVRNAVNFTSNLAREAVFQESVDFFDVLRWTSVLDGRTTLICATRDGDVVPMRDDAVLPEGATLLQPPGARPPAHLGGCRSIMVAIISAIGIVGERPFVTSTLTGEQRQIHFGRMARDDAGRRWTSMTRSERAAAVSKVRKQWAIEHIGTAPAKTTFEEFLARQSNTFQNEYLGLPRARAFRANQLELKDLVDVSGREPTLAELIERHPRARSLLSR